MPRRARIVAAGYPMHVILRGIDGAAVFFEDDARSFFLEALGVAAEEESVAVYAYVLMTNYPSTC
jgi:putative transposase